MIEDILKASGIEYRQGQYIGKPSTKQSDENYVVYFDDVAVDAPDYVPGLDLTVLPIPRTHDVTIELYTPVPDPGAQAAIERSILAHGLTYDKQDAIWLSDAQRYQVVYEMTYTIKE